MKFLFFFLFYTSLFAANECSYDDVYTQKCASLDIVPSYQCVLRNKKDISALCVQKSQDLFKYCTMTQLLDCATKENDEGNLFEMCLVNNYIGTKCSDAAKDYI